MRATLRILFVFSLAAVGVLYGQLRPQSANAFLYFPQLADGGSTQTEQWQTTFTFINPNSSPATVVLNLYRNDGGPLPLDLGAGLSSQVPFSIPPKGIRILASRIASQVTLTGWAVATASVPIQGIVAFRQFQNGLPKTEITAESTLPTMQFLPVANPFLGVAVANIYRDASLSISFLIRDANGSLLGQRVLSIPPSGHVSFNLWQQFPGLSPAFTGTVEITSTRVAPDYFVAWTLNGDGLGVVSTLPSGRYDFPVSHQERIWSTFLTVLDAAKRAVPDAFAATVALRIGSERLVNAYAFPDGNTVQINLATSEIIGDSDSELAFVFAHELGHILQLRTGRRRYVPSNVELDADVFGVFLTTLAGYDPYAAAGTFGKLQMASTDPGLLGEEQRQDAQRLGLDAHGAYSARIDSVLQALTLACSGEWASFCTSYKSLIHPSFPPRLPLGRGRERR